jgi:hypothetical protein
MRAYKKPNRPPCSLDGCSQPLYCKGFCVMHYSRLRTLGATGPAERLKAPDGSGFVNEYGYRVFYDRSHPLARAQGKVLEHRAVLYGAIGPGPHPCHWCLTPLNWDRPNGHGGLCVDHLDHDKLNNVPSNLVPSCLDCNAKRVAA